LKMRILVLSPYVPWPLNGGPPIRIYYVIRELVRLGHVVELVAGHDGPPLEDTHPLHSLCSRIITYQPPASARRGPPMLSALRSLASPLPYVAAKFGSMRVPEIVRRATEDGRVDLIWANFAFMADAVPADIARAVPVVLDEHESEGLLWRQYLRQGTLPKKVFAVINLLKLTSYQKRFMSKTAAMLSNSEREASFTRRYAPPGVPVLAVPNGVDTEAFAPAPDSQRRNVILICGGLAVYRNREAAIWFARGVFPIVRREVPDAEFWIVGSNANEEIWELAKLPGIHVTGTVEDVRPYYGMAKVTVAPYRYGEGTKIKVVEAMACGVPMVSTPTGCQGLDVLDGKHILIADSETDFARQVASLLRDQSRCEALAAAARRLAVERYSWKKIMSDLDPKLLELADRSGQRGTSRLQAAAVEG
jgi:glycosyltransferase involved in cell wall biosynthesis